MTRRSMILAVLWVLVSACGGPVGAPDPTPDSQPSPSTSSRASLPAASGSLTASMLHLVVIGDSIGYNSPEDCPGCTGFVDQYAATLEAVTGRTVETANRSRHDGAQSKDLDEQLQAGELDATLGSADVVVISIGINDGPPWPVDRPCGGQEAQTALAQVQVILAYDEACLSPTVESYRTTYRSIFDKVASLRRGDQVVTIVLTPFNNVIDHPEIVPLGLPAADLDRLYSLTKAGFDLTSALQCEEASAAGLECVDLYHAFNGANGLTGVGDNVGPDYIHPSQRGNDTIATLLGAVDVTALKSDR